MKAKLLFFASFCLANFALADEALSPLQAAYKFRMDLAKAVVGGELTADAALLRLKQGEDSVRQQARGADADLAEETLALGHHLLGLDRPAAAEVFLRAAEAALVQASQGARDNREKAEYLEKLATIRASYLDKVRQARADIDEAIRLQPDNKSLQEKRSLLARDRAEAFKAAKQ